MANFDPLSERERKMVDAIECKGLSLADAGVYAGYSRQSSMSHVYRGIKRKLKTWYMLEDEHPEVLDIAFGHGMSARAVLCRWARLTNKGLTPAKAAYKFVHVIAG